ncbi:methyltransferase domain-containing protein [Candidatus Pelagibacter sp.]|nr:methyltransferase domain-containing protein [Candidatus Pelagibacter sp.]
MQIIKIKKLVLQDGSILDMGSKKSISNITNFLNTNEKINYADKFTQDPKDIVIDLEIKNEFNDKKFKNIFLLNVLEHIYNFQNCLKNCYEILDKDGFFYGSTPFLFNIHGSPNDYFRYTEQSLTKSLKSAGFKNIEVEVICGGIFICFYSSISRITMRIPILNNILLFICQTLDLIINLFSKDIKKIFPLGYFFIGNK